MQPADFDVAALQRSLQPCSGETGAVVAFTGYVRGANDAGTVQQMALEHYPSMTEKSILAIMEAADERWPLLRARVVHRIGRLNVGEQIVWVGVSSAHREAAFSACEYIMDYLKTRAPFWKKEIGPEGEVWVEALEKDEDRAERWEKGAT